MVFQIFILQFPVLIPINCLYVYTCAASYPGVYKGFLNKLYIFLRIPKLYVVVKRVYRCAYIDVFRNFKTLMSYFMIYTFLYKRIYGKYRPYTRKAFLYNGYGFFQIYPCIIL